MDAFKNLLVYVDDRPKARRGLERAAAVAHQTGGRLTAMRIIDPIESTIGKIFYDGPELARLLPDSLRKVGTAAFEDEVRALRSEEHRVELEEWVQPHREQGLDVDVLVRWGTPFVELIRAIDERGHDLVVKTAMAPEDPGGLSFFGSTAMHLCRKSPVPVWVVGPREAPKVKRVVAAIDASGSDDSRDALNVRILEHAAELARVDSGGELHVARAWGSPSERRLGTWLARQDPRVFERALYADAREGVARVVEAANVDLPSGRLHFVEGAAREVIPRLGTQLGIEALVMGSVGRTGIPGLVIGETAEAILQRVACSVLVVKPEGFVSPVLTDASEVAAEASR